MNDNPKGGFQISLQRLFGSVAVFAVLFGLGMACIRSTNEFGPLLPIGIFFVLASVFSPVGFAIEGLEGGVIGFAVAGIVGFLIFAIYTVAIMNHFI